MACALVSDVVLYLAPRIAPGAAIHPGAVAFAAGIVILLGGLALRGWAFRTLGGYFTFTVMVSADQPVVSTGPYRLLRHPSYSTLLLICAGLGLTSACWLGLAIITVPPLVIAMWRIRVEEKALLATVNGLPVLYRTAQAPYPLHLAAVGLPRRFRYHSS